MRFVIDDGCISLALDKKYPAPNLSFMSETKKKLVKNYLSQKNSEGFAVQWVLFTLIICYGMSFLYWAHPIGEYLAASPGKVFELSEYWRLFTSSLIHADLSHFLSNSFMLIIMGYFVNYHYGALIFPNISFLFGILINLIVIWNYPAETSLVGASGVVYWLWGFWLVLYIGIQRHVPLYRRMMKVSIVGLFILVPSEFKAQTSYFAHGVGLVLGMIFGLVYFFIYSKKFYSSEVWEDEIEFDDEELAEEALSYSDKFIS